MTIDENLKKALEGSKMGIAYKIEGTKLNGEHYIQWVPIGYAYIYYSDGAWWIATIHMDWRVSDYGRLWRPLTETEKQKFEDGSLGVLTC